MSTLSQNNIVVNYVVNSASLDKAENEFQSITAAEKQSLAELRKLNTELKKTGDDGAKSVNKAGKELGGLGGVAKSVGGLIAGVFAVDQIKAFISESTKLTAQMQGYQKAIEFASGSQGKAAQNQKFLNETIERFGLSLTQTTEAYKSFLAAATFAGQSTEESNRIFKAVTQAGVVLRLNTEQMTGAFNALGQMMSKGNVQAEELRGQLGERIPGAFSLMARALNVNEQQLNKMLEQGQVLSRDALPKFAAELEKTFGPEVEKNLDNLIVSQNTFSNSVDSLSIAIGKKLEPALKAAYNRAAQVVGELTKIFSYGDKQMQFGLEAALQEERSFNQERKNALKMTDDQLDAEVKRLKVQIDAGKIASAGLKDRLGSEKLYKQSLLEVADATGRLSAIEEQIKLRREASAKTAQVEAQAIADREKKTKEELAALQKEFDSRRKILELIKQQRILQSRLANNRNGEMAAEREFYTSLAGLQESYVQKGLEINQIEIDNNKKAAKIIERDRVEAEKLAFLEIKKVQADALEERKLKHEKFSDDYNKVIERETEKIKEEERKRLEAQKQAEKERMELIQSSFDLASQLAGQINQLYQANLSNELTLLNRKYSEEIRLAEGNKQRQTELEEKRQQEEREIRKKAFQAQKAASVADVIFRTAPIIAQYLAGTVTAPLAAVAIAAQAAQIGFILAQPVPEFEKGTQGKPYKGKAIVGEKGQELVVTESGKTYLTPGQASLVDLKEKSHVLPAHITERLMGSYYANRTDNYGRDAATKELVEIKDLLSNFPVSALHLNEKGFERYIRTPNRRTKILNQRNS